MPRSDDDAVLVLAVRGGDQAAFGHLFRRWSDRCYDVARRIVHDDGRAAEVTQEVFLSAWQRLDDLQDPSAFGGWVLRASRNKALNRLEHERRATPLPDDAALFAGRSDGRGADAPVEAAMTALDHRELVAAATAVLGEREASVLDLHLRHGLSAAEIGEELGVTTNNAHQLLFRTKKRLTAGIRAWVLVRGGRPSCDGLAVALDAAGIASFGRPAVDVIDAHVEDCDDCRTRQAALLDPSALFAAAPVVALAPTARAAIEQALRDQGVPLAPARRPRGRALAVAAAALVLVVLGIARLASGGDDTQEVRAVAPTATTDPAPTQRTTTSTTPASSTTTTAASPSSTTTGPPATSVVPLPGPGSPTTTQAPAMVPPPAVTTTVAPAPPAPTTTVGPPTVDSFTATVAGAPGGSCGPGQWAHTLTWTTTRATSASITATTVGTVGGLAADGSRVVCRPTPGDPPGGWKLTATGPGGSASASA